MSYPAFPERTIHCQGFLPQLLAKTSVGALPRPPSATSTEPPSSRALEHTGCPPRSTPDSPRRCCPISSPPWGEAGPAEGTASDPAPAPLLTLQSSPARAEPTRRCQEPPCDGWQGPRQASQPGRDTGFRFGSTQGVRGNHVLAPLRTTGLGRTHELRIPLLASPHPQRF